MKKLALLLACVVALTGLFLAAIYHYDRQPKPQPTTVAASQYTAVKNELITHDQVNQHNLAQAQIKITNLTNQRNTLCTTYKTAKVVIPADLCQ